MTRTIVNQISQQPFQSDVLIPNSPKVSIDYQRFFDDLYTNAASVQNRAFQCQTRNPDFNILSANAYNPVTQASPQDTEIVAKWFVHNGGGANAFTFTPVAFGATEVSVTGSNNYLTVNVTSINQALYLWNQNYSTTGQFNGGNFYSNKTLMFSSIIDNTGNDRTQIRYSAMLGNYQEVKSGIIVLQPGINLIATSIQIPDLSGINLGPNPYMQPRLNIEAISSVSSTFDLYYVKAEVSNLASPLLVDHLLEILACNLLT